MIPEPATIAALKTLRARVVAGLWRNYECERNFTVDAKDRVGCLIQLCCRIPNGHTASERLTDALNLSSPDPENFIGLSVWNDAPHRTQADVLALIAEALVLAGEPGLDARVNAHLEHESYAGHDETTEEEHFA